MDFYQGCVLAAVLAFIILVIYAVRALVQITRTAEAAEYLVFSAASKVEKTDKAFQLVEDIAGVLDAGWYKALKSVSAFLTHFKK